MQRDLRAHPKDRRQDRITKPVWSAYADQLRKFVPPPGKSLLEAGRNGALTVSPAVLRQRTSRARILSTIRRLMPETGLDELHVAKIATEAGCAPQTLYNLVGNWSEMIASATNEWLEAAAEDAQKLASAYNLNALFVMIDFLWVNSLAEQQQVAAFVRSRALNDAVLQQTCVGLEHVFVQQLDALSDMDSLLHWVDVSVLAASLAQLAVDAVHHWMMTTYDNGDFRETLISSCGLALRGALQGTEVATLDRTFRADWIATCGSVS